MHQFLADLWGMVQPLVLFAAVCVVIGAVLWIIDLVFGE